MITNKRFAQKCQQNSENYTYVGSTSVYCLCHSKEIKIVNTYRNYNFENMAAAYPNDTYFDLRPNSAPEDYGKIFCF